MKAYFLAAGSGGALVELRDTATPEPKPGEILVRVRAASLNRGELLRGKIGDAAKPGGGECAGEVVKAGEGVTGVAAIQIGKALGARVIGTSGSPDKLARLEKIGLDVGILTRVGDFNDAVMKATDGQGVNLVVNNVGGSVFAECIRSLAFGGRLATVGHMDHVLSATIDLEALHRRRLTVFGVSNQLRSAAQRAETVRAFVRDILPYFEDGRLRPLIDRVFGFADLPAAIKFMESDAQVGKIVVRM